MNSLWERKEGRERKIPVYLNVVKVGHVGGNEAAIYFQ